MPIWSGYLVVLQTLTVAHRSGDAFARLIAPLICVAVGAFAGLRFELAASAWGAMMSAVSASADAAVRRPDPGASERGTGRKISAEML
jgi:hypothetical protein